MATGSVLKPEGSMIAGLAVVGLVIANYNLQNGSASSVALSPANDATLTTTNKKAGWTAIVMVSGVALLARDANVFILGMAAVIAMHSSYLHSIATSPSVNAIVSGPETAGAYVPATA
jgi:hypothetical protein